MNPPENNKAKPEPKIIHGTEHAAHEPFVVKAVPDATKITRMTRTQHDTILPLTEHPTAQPFVPKQEPSIPRVKITQHDTEQPFVPIVPVPTAPPKK